MTRLLLTVAFLAALIAPASASHHHRHHHWQHVYGADLPVHFIYKHVKRKEVSHVNRRSRLDIQSWTPKLLAGAKLSEGRGNNISEGGASASGSATYPQELPIWELTKMCIENVQEFMRERRK